MCTKFMCFLGVWSAEGLQTGNVQFKQQEGLFLHFTQQILLKKMVYAF